MVLEPKIFNPKRGREGCQDLHQNSPGNSVIDKPFSQSVLHIAESIVSLNEPDYPIAKKTKTKNINQE